MDQKEIPLPGKIGVSKSDRTFVVYDSKTTKTEFKLRDDKKFRYSGLKWLHHTDSFVGVEYLQTENGRIYQGNVARFDSKGQLVERIYESAEGVLAGDTYPSWDDKKLLITIERVGNSKENPLEGLTRNQSVMILDLQQKKVTKEIENIGSSPALEIEESPWLPDGDHFVYSLTSGRKIVSEGEVIDPLDKGYAGVYLYDLVTDERKLLVAGAHFAVASPVSNQIAYIKGNAIAVLDLDKNVEKIVYEFGAKDRVPDIHWTPDGNHLYLACYHYHMGSSDLFTTAEKLVDVRTSKEIPFTNIGHGFQPYTWK